MIQGLREARSSEAAAQKALEQAREARIKREAAQTEWNQLVMETDIHQADLTRASQRVQLLEDSIRKLENLVQDQIAAPDSTNSVFGLADSLFVQSGSLPLLRAAYNSLGERFKNRVAEIRDRGKQLGVPKSAIDTLPF